MMHFSDFCGEVIGLLIIQIKLHFKDMLDNSWLQNACVIEPRTFPALIERETIWISKQINKNWADLI